MRRWLSPEARTALARATDRLGLSGRAVARTCRVARTIANLEGETTVGPPHVAEALMHRLPAFTAAAPGAPATAG